MTSVKTPTKKAIEKEFSSPNTPIKQAVRVRQEPNGKDSKCLCCQVLLVGAKATYNLSSNRVLFEELRGVLQRSIDLNVVSGCVCRPGGCKIEALSKRNIILSSELEEFR